MTRLLLSRFCSVLCVFALTLALAASADAQPRRAASPQTSLDFGGTAVSVSIQAGGSDQNVIQGSGCSGYIDYDAPSAAVTVSRGGTVSFYVTSSSDTTLLISGPDGRWHCSDDAVGGGSNPAITFPEASEGEYVVWVGTWSADGGGAESTLNVVNGAPAW